MSNDTPEFPLDNPAHSGAHTAGYKARMAGKQFNDNPYDMNDHRFGEWSYGWLDADDEGEDEDA